MDIQQILRSQKSSGRKSNISIGALIENENCLYIHTFFTLFDYEVCLNYLKLTYTYSLWNYPPNP